MTDKIYKAIMYYINQYKQTVLNNIAEELMAEGMRQEEVDDIIDQYIDSEEMNDAIDEELSNENFDDEEIGEVINQSMSDETALKFLRFAVGLIEDDEKADETELTEEAIEQLVDKYL